MQQKKTTKEEYQKCVNVVVEYIIQHLGEDIDLKSLARISNFSTDDNSPIMLISALMLIVATMLPLSVVAILI